MAEFGESFALFHDFFRWINDTLGKDICETDPASPLTSSWAGNYHESQTLWSITEGAHVITLVLFAGTILLVDLRMLGLAFKKVPFSKINDKVLPLTIVGFALMIVTGILLFLAKPLEYYHSIWFRMKMVFLFVAAVNIFWFHFVVQKSQDEWDAMEKPPAKVRMSAIVSLTCWSLIICFGRFIPYNWFEPGRILSMIQDSVVAKGIADGKISQEQLQTAADNGVIPAVPRPHAWTFGDTMAEGFFRTVYALCECDRVRGPATTLESFLISVDHPEQVPKLPIELEGESDAAEMAEKCVVPDAAPPPEEPPPEEPAPTTTLPPDETAPAAPAPSASPTSGN